VYGVLMFSIIYYGAKTPVYILCKQQLLEILCSI